jgi:Flp pilus assembly pilin Flp
MAFSAKRREERGASFTEYVVLVAVVVAFIIGIGFTGIGNALTTKITSIASSITSSGSSSQTTDADVDAG